MSSGASCGNNRKRKSVGSPLSMVSRNGTNLVVKSVVSGTRLFDGSVEKMENGEGVGSDHESEEASMSDSELWMDEIAMELGLGPGPEDPNLLPDCRIKRNYSCPECSFFTQNPRRQLYHMRDVHGERMKIYECKWCVYASRHCQKLQRHVRMCHGPTAHLSGKAPARGMKEGLRPRTAPQPKNANSSSSSTLPVLVSATTGGEKIQCREGRTPLRKDESSDGESFKPGDAIRAGALQQIDEHQAEEGSTEEYADEDGDDGGFHSNIEEDGEEPNPKQLTIQSRKGGHKENPIRKAGATESSSCIGKKFFRCSTCTYVTNVKARYTKHVKYHSMPLIKCDFCDFKTPYKWNLDRHYKNHNGEGNLHCPLCNFTADIKQSLTVHVQNHHSNVPVNRMNEMLLKHPQLGGTETFDASLPQSLLPYHLMAGLHPHPFLDDCPPLDDDEPSTSKAGPYFNNNDDDDNNAVVEDEKEDPSKQDFIHPEDIVDKNGKIYIKKLRCRLCDYRAVWETEMSRHLAKAHGWSSSASATGVGGKRRNSASSSGSNSSSGSGSASGPKPMPNLIPIPILSPNTGSSTGGTTATPLSAGHSAAPGDVELGRRRESNNSSTKTGTPAGSPQRNKEVVGFSHCQQDNEHHYQQQQQQREPRTQLGQVTKSMFLQHLSLTPVKGNASSVSDSEVVKSGAPVPVRHSSNGVVTITPIPGTSKTSAPSGSILNSKFRRRTSFFDKLSQKLVANRNSAPNEEIPLDMSKSSVTITATMASTSVSASGSRCQYCRLRCKSTADLANHLSTCVEAEKAQLEDDEEGNGDQLDSVEDGRSSNGRLLLEALSGFKSNGDTGEEDLADGDYEDGKFGRGIMWNHQDQEYGEDEEDYDGDDNGDVRSHFLEGGGGLEDLVGYETAPGIGAIHLGKLEEAEYEGYNGNLFVDGQVTTTRKVYRCPESNCGFWATTASRFHVHSVGHDNLKPFECSECSYKSNWRWDITKHIRLKAVRDKKHHSARVLLTHESGQRNYRKYDQHLIMMQLKHSAASKLPDCSTVASKRTDVELSPPPPSKIFVTTSKMSPTGVVAGPNQMRVPMPKLTRAPVPQEGRHSPASSVTSEDGAMMTITRPPPLPALKPMSNPKIVLNLSSSSSSSGPGIQHFVEKRILSGGQMLSVNKGTFNKSSPGMRNGERVSHSPNFGNESQMKRQRIEVEEETKKVLWKCKKCPFKHESKEMVVVHIRQYHKPKKGEPVSILNRNNFTSVLADDQDTMEDQDSPNNSTISAGSDPVKETHQYVYFETKGQFRCKFCPFITSTLSIMESHAENHFSKPNSHFSCAFCSFSVPSKKELQQHLILHDRNEITAAEKPTKEKVPLITADEVPPKPRSAPGSGNSPYKKYHCTECPYVTDSKGQFLYHKQFHRPRDCQFKCGKCSYNVSHKHLLHQHLRVHGLLPSATDMSPSTASPANKSSSNTNNAPNALKKVEPTKVNTQTSAEYPTVLIWRNGKPYRVFRCRGCPQVYTKISDLTDHELTHGIKPKLVASASSMATASKSPGELPKLTPAASVSGIDGGLIGQSPGVIKNVLYFCEDCPARFFYEKELRIHSCFHIQKSQFQCQLCTYSARQENPHLMSHMKVHGEEYQSKTQQLLLKFPAAPKLPTLSSKPKASLPATGPLGFSTAIVCQSCPAKFQTPAMYQQHAACHGRDTMFNCRYCDFGADNFKHHSLHELLHTSTTAEDSVNSEPEIPTTSSFQVKAGPDNSFEDEACQGNPDFTYPTYVKNGRIKIKRYKCKKCPSAFEKRDQYKVHIGLHGSDQRYKCGVCDYAVTYYANFIQHLKKHATQPDVPPELLIAKPISKTNASSAGSPSGKVTTKPGRIWKCPSCPYTSNDQFTLEDHKAQHVPIMTKAKQKSHAFQCSFCDFSCGRQNVLKEHTRLHFHIEMNSNEASGFMRLTEDVDIYVEGADDEKIYSEKENYDECTDVENPKEQVSYIHFKTSLPVGMLEHDSADEQDITTNLA